MATHLRPCDVIHSPYYWWPELHPWHLMNGSLAENNKGGEMATLKSSVPIKQVLENVTVEIKITGLTKWRFQVWVAGILFKLGAFIMNINIDFKRT